MAELEQQDEEKEVLLSIYEGDSAFKQISPTVYQYKADCTKMLGGGKALLRMRKPGVNYREQYGKDGDPKSFLLEISWGKTYPADKPTVNMNTFYNKHIVDSVKQRICEHVLSEADQYLGEAMTYTLFESAREQVEELTAEQPETPDIPVSEPDTEVQEEIATKKAAVRKEQLSKAQKRKQWDRVDGRGEKPRGWDWVDIVKHLSQTGPKEDTTVPSS